MIRIHYGWVICAASTMLLFVTMGTVSNGFSVYLPYIMAAYGFSHSQTSFLITLRCLTSFFSMLCIGIYYRNVSFRLGTGIAAVCAGAAFCLYSTAETYPVFCLGAAVSGFSYGLGSMIPVSILMNQWFVKHRALALAVCASGSGIATILLPPVTTALVETLSLKTAFRLESLGILLLAAVIVLLLRNHPAELGLQPYGWETPPAEAPEAASPTASFTLTARGWFLMVCVCLTMGALANPGFSHLSVLYTEAGFDPAVVAVIISAIGIMITAGKLIYGQAADLIGGRHSYLLFGGILLAGHLLCCLAFTQSLPVCAGAVFCLGLGYPIATMGPSVLANDMCSPDHYPTVLRRFQVIYAGGALVFASVPGILADHFGSYLSSYLLFSLLLALTLVCAAFAYREARTVKHKNTP